MDDEKLLVIIQDEKPIAVNNIAEMFVGLNKEYERFMSKRFSIKKATLHIRAVKEGSQVYELVSLIPVAIDGIGQINSLFEFGGHLKDAITTLLGTGKSASEISSPSKTNIKKIIGPTLDGNGMQLSFDGDFRDANININIDMERGRHLESLLTTSNREVEAAPAQRLLSESSQTHYLTEKIFYWDEDGTNRPISKGIIENFSMEPVEVRMAENLRSEMVDNVDPNAVLYLVDVEAETYRGRPVIYKILKLYGIRPKLKE